MNHSKPEDSHFGESGVQKHSFGSEENLKRTILVLVFEKPLLHYYGGDANVLYRKRNPAAFWVRCPLR